MADLEAEMARFEAELAGVAQAAPSAGPSQVCLPCHLAAASKLQKQRKLKHLH